jgi:adenylate cyclase
LWTERFDGALKDVFAVQDEIVQKVVAALRLKVTEAELRRSRSVRPTDLRAYDYYLRGSNLDFQNSRADNLESQRLFQSAIELDPGFALAYSALGLATLNAAGNGWMQNPRRGLKRALDLANTAIEIEAHAQAHAVLGMTYLLTREFDRSAEELLRAIDANPNDANSYAALGLVNLWTSQLDAAQKAYRTSMRLDPRSSPTVITGVAIIHLLKEEYAQAAKLLEKAVAAAPNQLLPLIALTSAYGHIGRLEEAAQMGTRIDKIHPFFSSEPYRVAFSNPIHGERFVAGLAKVGIQ